MKRWNGWGEETTSYPLPEAAHRYLAQTLGQGCRAADVTLPQALASVPTSRLPDHPQIHRDPLERLLHARGQSLPDWVALRSGRVGIYPDGVAYPASETEVHALLEICDRSGFKVIPYGGGTSVVGHINPPASEAPVLTVDLSRMDQVLSLDTTSRLAHLQAGMRGPDLELKLNTQGYTLGHFPQSFEYSTLGGWIATRSSGQQSFHYGRIEDLFAGGHLETPAGPVDLPPLPASAAGPDLRQLVLGSEGRLGVITSAIVRIRPLPQVDLFFGAFFHDWASGANAVREIAQCEVPASMLRLSDARETESTLALSGKERLVAATSRGLAVLGYAKEPCLMVYGITGNDRFTHHSIRQLSAIIRKHKGLPTGRMVGNMWRKSRFLTPYLRNTLWEHGIALDTLETALPWTKVLDCAIATQSAMATAAAGLGERLLVFAHLSHVYADGASLYITYLFRRQADPQATLELWSVVKTAASLQIQAHGGTISHQHGVGSDHAIYLPAEKGQVGISMLKAACLAADPQRIMNPDKLLA